MNTQVELSIASTYVADWGYVEAIRELVQNAVDQDAVNGNTMVLNYNERAETLTITSIHSKLDRTSLLLGHTTKASQANAIGNFGEGYKLALMVLSRLGLIVQVENFGMEELWLPSIEHSPTFNAKVLSIEIAKIIGVTDHTDLVFVIDGITSDMMEKVLESNLHLSSYPKHIEADKGNILTDPTMQGKLFVAGLFVQKVTDLQYGYDFNPSHIELDRDRRMISSFDLTWLTGNMWSELGETQLIKDMLKANALDVKHYHVHSAHTGEVATAVYDDFIEEHGVNAVPVRHQSELANMKALGRKPIICPEGYADVVSSVIAASNPIISVPQKQPVDYLEALVDRSTGTVVDDIYPKLLDVINEAEDWTL